MMDIKIYNANQIGGNFTVFSTSKGKVMFDYGLALPGAKESQEDFDWEHDTVVAVFITHYHGDHAGKLLDIPKNIPIYMGTTARQIMLNVHEELVRAPGCRKEQERWIKLLNSNRIKEVQEAKPINVIEGITVTPYSVDHSAYDAYMYLIEGDGEVALHTGDFRGHGYRGGKMLEVIKYYVHKNGRKVDYLVCEGTMMGVRQNEHVKTEYEVYKEAKDLFRDNKYVFLVVSSTNFDSIVSFYRAARDNKMYTYCYSRYLYKQLRTFSRAAGKKSPRYKFKDVYTVNFQKQLSHELWDENKTQEEVMRDHGFLCIIKAEEKYSEWIERFKDKNPMVIYSMWDGYLQEKRQGEKNLAYNKEWAKFFQPYERKGQLKKIHTSGHATGKMLADVINAVNPKKGIYPMHTENADGFRALEIGEELKALIKVAG